MSGVGDRKYYTSYDPFTSPPLGASFAQALETVHNSIRQAAAYILGAAPGPVFTKVNLADLWYARRKAPGADIELMSFDKTGPIEIMYFTMDYKFVAPPVTPKDIETLSTSRKNV